MFLTGNLCVSVKNMLGCWAVMCKRIPSSNVTEKTLSFRGGGLAAIVKNTAQRWIEMVKVAKQESKSDLVLLGGFVVTGLSYVTFSLRAGFFFF
jgi:hypothetical protein